jgi:hypothetical protein
MTRMPAENMIRVVLADDNPPAAERLAPELVKGRQTPVGAYRVGVPA